MSMNKWLSTGMILVAVAGLNGCEKLKNKPKDPLVEGEPSPFYGVHNGVEVDGKAGMGLYFGANVQSGSKFGTVDYLSDKVDDKFPFIRQGQFSRDRDFGWFTEKNNKSSQFGGADVSGLNWFMVDTGQASLRFGLKALDPTGGVDEQDGGEAVGAEEADDISLLDGEFNCLQTDILPEATVRHADLTLAQGQGLLLDKTQGGFPASQSISLVLGESAKVVVSGTSGQFDRVCAGLEPEGFQDDLYDYLMSEYPPMDQNYRSCWTATTQGAFQLDGDVLFYTTIAVPSVERRRYFDVNQDGLEDTSGEEMPDSWRDFVNNEDGSAGADGLQDGNNNPNLPPKIAEFLTPDAKGLTGVQGFRPIRSTTYCLRKGESLSAESLTGTFWMGQSIHEPLDDYVLFSAVGFDGVSLVAEKQLETSGSDNKRELGYSYFVDSQGELTVNGRQGMMSADGRMFFFDISNPETGRVGFAVGIKEARLQ